MPSRATPGSKEASCSGVSHQGFPHLNFSLVGFLSQAEKYQGGSIGRMRKSGSNPPIIRPAVSLQRQSWKTEAVLNGGYFLLINRTRHLNCSTEAVFYDVSRESDGDEKSQG